MPDLSPAALVLLAADYAARQHRDQRRKGSNTPYVNHPLSVARRIVGLGGVDDPVTLAAALLHDTIEDTGSTREELAGMFGEDVASVVVEVTDDKHLAKAARKREQIRHALELTPRARVVKLADKLDNLDDLTRTVPNGWDRERVRGYFVWAFAVVANLRGANAGLEAALDEVFAREVRLLDYAPFRAVPADAGERDALLQSYLAAMERADD
ncbi:MAG: HD domain-containing protein [Planctomycetes bacterium]|nr:HD domain-containing protein [Planctomycetota bacterium]